MKAASAISVILGCVAVVTAAPASAAPTAENAWLETTTRDALSLCNPNLTVPATMASRAAKAGWQPSIEAPKPPATHGFVKLYPPGSEPFVTLLFGSEREAVGDIEISRVDCVVLSPVATKTLQVATAGKTYPGFRGEAWAGRQQANGALTPLTAADLSGGRANLLLSLQDGERLVSVGLEETGDSYATHVRIYEKVR